MPYNFQRKPPILKYVEASEIEQAARRRDKISRICCHFPHSVQRRGCTERLNL
jgi:hypothetical protein